MRFVRKQTVAVVLHPLFNILRSQKSKKYQQDPQF
jgi:hypothetical protein